MTTIIVHRSSKTTYSLHLPKEKDSNNLEWANKPPKSISVEMSLAMVGKPSGKKNKKEFQELLSLGKVA